LNTATPAFTRPRANFGITRRGPEWLNMPGNAMSLRAVITLWKMDI
jgi:hypothetical protein